MEADGSTVFQGTGEIGQQAKLGCAPAHRLFDLVSVKKKDGVTAPRSFANYTVTFNKSALPSGVKAGFAVVGAGGRTEVIWDTPPVGIVVM